MSKMRRQAVARAGVDSTDFQLPPHFTGGESEASRGSGSCPKTSHQVLGQTPTREPASDLPVCRDRCTGARPRPQALPPDALLLSCHHPPPLTSLGRGGPGSSQATILGSHGSFPIKKLTHF